MHESIKRKYPLSKVLEVSTKSANETGVSLSAFNMKVVDSKGEQFCLENVFQASKVFENKTQYKELLNMSPGAAKRDERLRKSGPLKAFYWDGIEWPLVPETLFYDWLYISALVLNEELAKKALDYNVFTDIEFNHKKSINCQARSVAIYVGLKLSNKLEQALQSQEAFKRICYGHTENVQQMTF